MSLLQLSFLVQLHGLGVRVSLTSSSSSSSSFIDYSIWGKEVLSKLGEFVKRVKSPKIIIPSFLVLLLTLLAVVPVLAAAPTYIDSEGIYYFTRNVKGTYLDGTSHPSMLKDSLILEINTQTDNVVSSASLLTGGEEIALTGFIGGGTRPYVTLTGTTDGATVLLQGRISTDAGVPTGMSGRLTGHSLTYGNKWDDSADGTAADSTAQAYSGAYSVLLTAGTLTNPEAVILYNPTSNLRVSSLDTLAAGSNGLSFYYYASQATNGPQMMLRFTPTTVFDTSYYSSDAHVDVTVMPLQSGAATTTWTKYSVTSTSGPVVYYGNDPTDGTAFDGLVATLADVEAAIDAEAAMIAGTDSASNWKLSMVSVELWEGGARTVYIDDIQIGTKTYLMDPMRFEGSFRARFVEWT